jgi:hypothetical protein
MNTKLVRAFVALSIFFVSAHASAIPVLMEYLVIFSHSQGTLGAGLTIDARTTDTSRLVVGGGYTIRCGSSALQIDAKNNSVTTGFTQVRILVKVPAGLSPTSYPVLGWTNILPASCTQCTMTHTYAARDETTATASIGVMGTGMNFALVPTGEIGTTDTTVLSAVCRGGRPQCCTPGCSIP